MTSSPESARAYVERIYTAMCYEFPGLDAEIRERAGDDENSYTRWKLLTVMGRKRGRPLDPFRDFDIDKNGR